MEGRLGPLAPATRVALLVIPAARRGAGRVRNSWGSRSRWWAARCGCFRRPHRRRRGAGPCASSRARTCSGSSGSSQSCCVAGGRNFSSSGRDQKLDAGAWLASRAGRAADLPSPGTNKGAAALAPNACEAPPSRARPCRCLRLHKKQGSIFRRRGLTITSRLVSHRSGHQPSSVAGTRNPAVVFPSQLC
jgi:hypothetical protein